MELRHLEYFIQVCNNNSFTKAAEVLGISQPTLSQQIRVLEGELDTPLFHRVGRGIKMTEEVSCYLIKENLSCNNLMTFIMKFLN